MAQETLWPRGRGYSRQIHHWWDHHAEQSLVGFSLTHKDSIVTTAVVRLSWQRTLTCDWFLRRGWPVQEIGLCNEQYSSNVVTWVAIDLLCSRISVIPAVSASSSMVNRLKSWSTLRKCRSSWKRGEKWTPNSLCKDYRTKSWTWLLSFIFSEESRITFSYSYQIQSLLRSYFLRRILQYLWPEGIDKA